MIFFYSHVLFELPNAHIFHSIWPFSLEFHLYRHISLSSFKGASSCLDGSRIIRFLSPNGAFPKFDENKTEFIWVKFGIILFKWFHQNRSHLDIKALSWVKRRVQKLTKQTFNWSTTFNTTVETEKYLELPSTNR